MAMETITSDSSAWPAVGNPHPPPTEDPNPEWEMIAEEENENAASPSSIVILTSAAAPVASEALRKDFPKQGRPRSATIGGEAAAVANNNPKSFVRGASGKVEMTPSPRRTLRRSASTPDLMVTDNAHEVIVEDETDSDNEDEEDRGSSEDAELIEAEQEEEMDDSAFLVEAGEDPEESFEVLSDKNIDSVEEDEEPVMIDEDSSGGEESATLVSTPSCGVSSWTMASSANPASTSAWGVKKSPSFADMVAKNIDDNGGQWGKDKVLTEANLLDSHRRHHLRVRTKPKLVVTKDNGNGGAPGGGRMMKHAHSTGDLSKMLHKVEGGHESVGRSPRRVRKQLSAMMEEDDEGADFVIGRGSGNNCGGGGGGGDGGGGVMGDTDAMDYYQRKEHGSKSTSNKKKERPDEAKRREISVYKRDMQRKKQMEASGAGGGQKGSGEDSGKKKKKKNDKGFGGKKERRRL